MTEEDIEKAKEALKHAKEDIVQAEEALKKTQGDEPVPLQPVAPVQPAPQQPVSPPPAPAQPAPAQPAPVQPVAQPDSPPQPEAPQPAAQPTPAAQPASSGKARVEFDRENCIGAGACVAANADYWSIDEDGKANLKSAVFDDSKKMWVLEIDDEEQFRKQMDAAGVCPVTVIHVYDKDGNQQI